MVRSALRRPPARKAPAIVGPPRARVRTASYVRSTNGAATTARDEESGEIASEVTLAAAERSERHYGHRLAVPSAQGEQALDNGSHDPGEQRAECIEARIGEGIAAMDVKELFLVPAGDFARPPSGSILRGL